MKPAEPSEFHNSDANAQRKILRNFRKAHGLSQKALGELAGVDHTTISRFERGDSDMSPAVHHQIFLVIETMLRMRKRIDQAEDARKRYPDFDEKSESLVKKLGMFDSIPPADPSQLREWRKRMFPFFKKNVDVDSTQMAYGGTVGEYTRALKGALKLAIASESDLKKERDELKRELLEAREKLVQYNGELLEAYRRIVDLEKELERRKQ